MLTINDDWEFNALGNYTYKKLAKLDYLISFIMENHRCFAGDIFEVGVFKGSSLIDLCMISLPLTEEL